MHITPSRPKLAPADDIQNIRKHMMRPDETQARYDRVFQLQQAERHTNELEFGYAIGTALRWSWISMFFPIKLAAKTIFYFFKYINELMVSFLALSFVFFVGLVIYLQYTISVAQ